MKKTILLLVAIVVFIAVAVPSAFAATPEQERIDAVYAKMIELRKELIDSYVLSGQITEEQGALMKERMDYAAENRGQFRSRGFGGGFGGGFCGGGFGGFGGGGLRGGANVY